MLGGNINFEDPIFRRSSVKEIETQKRITKTCIYIISSSFRFPPFALFILEEFKISLKQSPSSKLQVWQDSSVVAKPGCCLGGSEHAGFPDTGQVTLLGSAPFHSAE